MAMNIGTRREPLWDYTLVDKDKTTATLSVNHPERRQMVFKADKYWEGEGGTYACIVPDDDGYKFYYDGSGRHTYDPYTLKLNENCAVSCYVNTPDGVHFERENLGIYGDTNVILKDTWETRCGFMVFKDKNPLCPPEERYKGVQRIEKGGGDFTKSGALATFVSADGIHFTEKEITIDEQGKFDSANVAFYDKEDGLYKIIHRDFENGNIRALRLRTSKDFKNWDDRGFFKYDDGQTIQMYTNNVQKYRRAPHVYIGLPVRYVERLKWNENYDYLPDKEYRASKCYEPNYPRWGLALTDSLFMTSRDGVNWHRFDEAFCDGGYEKSGRWLYGDGYFAYGMIDGEDEHYLYSFEKGTSDAACELWQHAIRFDGFASFKAKYSGAEVVTKPFIFEGNELSINFRTSAAGSIYVVIEDESGNAARSIEIFGNNIDRKVKFNKSLEAFAGKNVTIKFKMRDAEIYSFKFGFKAE